MKLDKLWIQEFKTLRDLCIDFDDKSLTTVLVGQNGAGKSYVLDALVSIFRNLDLDEDPPFTYSLVYTCKGYKVTVDADPTRKSGRLRFKVDGRSVARKNFGRQYLPNHLFGYYSGTSKRLEEYFDRHQEQFYKDLIRDRTQSPGLDDSPRPLRPLFYARLVHSNFVLLAFFGRRDPDTVQFLRHYLGIEGLESILFVLRTPVWADSDQTARDQEGAPRFWDAKGTVRQFLFHLYKRSLAPIVLTQTVQEDMHRRRTREYFYLYLKDQPTLESIVAEYEDQPDFFKAVESTYVSDLIDEVRVKVRVATADGSLTFRDLSEGERQLLMVLGLLRFTKDEESLFLLDEPDTHPNPAWSVRYVDLLEETLGDGHNSHIIMTTHDPLLLSGLKREQVQILYRDPAAGTIKAQVPDHDPRGMGVAGILTSELFGLRSTLDLKTLHRLERKRDLTYAEEPLSSEDLRELEYLNKQLEHVDYVNVARDPLYEPYVRAMTRNREYKQMRRKEILSEGDQGQIRQLAEEILRELEER